MSFNDYQSPFFRCSYLVMSIFFLCSISLFIHPTKHKKVNLYSERGFMRMSNIGRRPVLTSKVIKLIYELIASGEFDKSVAGYIGVSEVSWHNWKRRGKEIQEKMQADNSYIPTNREQLYLDFVETL